MEKNSNKDNNYQTKTHSAASNTMSKSTIFDSPKTKPIFVRPNIAGIISERSKPINTPGSEHSEPCIGLTSTDVAPEIPMVLALLPPDHNLTTTPGIRPMFTAFHRPAIATEKPNAIYLDFERPNTLKRSIPEEVNWTRMDLQQRKVDAVPTSIKVAMGVFCGSVASATVHPLDVIKVRLQLFPEQMTTVCMFERILACEGLRGLYAGLTAGILRQLTYTSTRLAVYHSLYTSYKDTHGKYPEFNDRMRIAIVAGLAGAFMGVPSEVALVRMIESRRLRRSQCSPTCSKTCRKIQYPEWAIQQLLRLARTEGISACWRGVVPTVVRSIFVTSAQVGVYTEIRKAFTMGDFVYSGPYLHFYIAGISSIVAALLSLPVDQVKTRYQSYKERHLRTGDILKDLLKKKGFRYLWKGFIPYYLRQAVHTMITYVILDQLIEAYADVDNLHKEKK